MSKGSALRCTHSLELCVCGGFGRLVTLKFDVRDCLAASELRGREAAAELADTLICFALLMTARRIKARQAAILALEKEAGCK